MVETILERDAFQLLHSIGDQVEQWILEHARLKVEGGDSEGNQVVHIQPAHIRESLRAFLAEGMGELHRLTIEPDRSAESSLSAR